MAQLNPRGMTPRSQASKRTQAASANGEKESEESTIMPSKLDATSVNAHEEKAEGANADGPIYPLHVLTRYPVSIMVLALTCGLGWFYGRDSITAYGSDARIASRLGNFLFEILGADITLFVIPPVFSRFAMPISASETLWYRLVWSVIVGAAAYINHRLRLIAYCNDYSIILVVHAASYLFALPIVTSRWWQIPAICCSLVLVAYSSRYGLNVLELRCISAMCWTLMGYVVASNKVFYWSLSHPLRLVLAVIYIVIGFLATRVLPTVLYYFLPIEELTNAFILVSDFVAIDVLRKRGVELLLITLNIQIPLGYLGISFLRQQQARQNYMLRIGEGKLSANRYTRYVLRYIMVIAVPYMLQRTAMESVNSYAMGCFSRDLDNVLRIETVLPAENQSGVLLAAVGESNHTLSSFADSFDAVVSGSFGIVERKLFSLPKIALLPGMLVSKPWLVVSVLPASILLDAGKSWLVGLLSSRIEEYAEEIQKVVDLRQRIEQHDTKYEELIRRGAVGKLTKDRWYDVSKQLSDLTLRSGALESVRSFVQWLYWQDFMIPGFECALGFLLEVGHITNVDIYLYIRVVEDSIDMLLTRSRLQTKLASMETNMQRLRKLKSGLANIRTRTSAQCEVHKSKHLSLKNVIYSRGESLRVQIPYLSFAPGVYAVTGANGCGKSTFFGILVSCGGTTLPVGTEIDATSQIMLPSDDIVEITQQVYCPIHIKPILWFLRNFDTKQLSTEKMSYFEAEIMKALQELQFSSKNSSENLVDLHAEKEDWFGELSGGQKLKVELIAKIFLRERCPAIVLLDEAFGPLDPDSKLFVQRKLKSFCSESTVLVIYHADVSAGCVGGDGDEFFDGNIRFVDGTARLETSCSDAKVVAEAPHSKEARSDISDKAKAKASADTGMESQHAVESSHASIGVDAEVENDIRDGEIDELATIDTLAATVDEEEEPEIETHSQQEL